MIGAVIACDHAEARRAGHLPTALGLQSLYGFGPLVVPKRLGARPEGVPAPRRGRASAGEAGNPGTGPIADGGEQ